MQGRAVEESRINIFDPVPEGHPTLFGLPSLSHQISQPFIAFLGVPYAVPYRGLGPELPSAAAPMALRRASLAWQPYFRNYDVDFGAAVLSDSSVPLFDVGDVHLEPGDHRKNRERIVEAIRFLLQRGALPIVLGGDHAVTIPVLQAYSPHHEFCVVQIDAHLDWRDEVEGVREGSSSPMRRASELAGVTAMVQIELRGTGSGRAEEFAAARAWGSIIIPARLVHERGIDWVLTQIPDSPGYYLTIDADGLDPSLFPAVNAPSPGGLTYWQVFDLVSALTQRAPLIGCDLVELAPYRDPTGVTLASALRLLQVLVSTMAQSGWFRQPGTL